MEGSMEVRPSHTSTCFRNDLPRPLFRRLQFAFVYTHMYVREPHKNSLRAKGVSNFTTAITISGWQFLQNLLTIVISKPRTNYLCLSQVNFSNRFVQLYIFLLNGWVNSKHSFAKEQRVKFLVWLLLQRTLYINNNNLLLVCICIKREYFCKFFKSQKHIYMTCGFDFFAPFKIWNYSHCLGVSSCKDRARI